MQEENWAINNVLFSCIGREVTDRVKLRRKEDGSEALLLDGEERSPVEWKG